MKKLTLMALIMILFAALPLRGQTVFSTTLSGGAETAVCDQDGTGLAVVSIDGTSVDYILLIQKLGTVGGAHIQRGLPGTNGEIVIDFAPSFSGGRASGTVAADQAILDEILGNPAGFYVNVHTAECSAGAIRGQLAQSSGNEVVFPIVGSGPGAGGTRWITDLRILNREERTVNVTLSFFGQSSEAPGGPRATATISIPSGRQMVLDDVIQTQFGLEQFGALKLVANGEVRADARILNDRRANDEGTAGFAIEGFDLQEAATSGALPLLSQGVDFRTNLGYYNPNPETVELTLLARSTTDGSVVGEVTLPVESHVQVQQGVFALIHSVPAGERARENFYVTWSATGPMFVYGSVVDNKTGDSIYVK